MPLFVHKGRTGNNLLLLLLLPREGLQHLIAAANLPSLKVSSSANRACSLVTLRERALLLHNAVTTLLLHQVLRYTNSEPRPSNCPHHRDDGHSTPPPPPPRVSTSFGIITIAAAAAAATGTHQVRSGFELNRLVFLPTLLP